MVNKETIRDELRKFVGEGVSIEVVDIANTFYRNALLVEVYVKGMRDISAAPPEKILGLSKEKLTEKGQRAFGNFKGNRCYFLPEESQRALAKYEQRARSLLKKYEIDKELVSRVNFKEFQQDFAMIKNDYLMEVQRILNMWDVLVRRFDEDNYEFFESVFDPYNPSKSPEVQANDLRKLEFAHKSVLAKIPNKDVFEKSFDIGYRVRAFAPTPLTEGLSDDPELSMQMDDDFYDDVMTKAVNGIKACFAKGYMLIANALSCYQKSVEKSQDGGEKARIQGTSLVALKNFASEVRAKNLFSNSLLTRIADTLDQLEKFTDVSDKAEVLEAALTDCYQYSKEKGLSLDFKDNPFTEKQLDDMLSLREYIAA